MIKEAIGFGNSIDEARENAIANLNPRPDDDLQFEVIATGKKKVLGLFGGEKAQVRVFVEIPDKKSDSGKKQKPAQKEKPDKAISAKKADKSDEKPLKAQENKKIEPSAKPAAQKAEGLNVEPAKPVDDGYGEPVDPSALAEGSRAAKSVTYLKKVLEQLNCSNISIKVAEKENGALITLDGEGLGAAIGHRGETLDALQYLTSLAANNGGGYFRVVINIGNYREKREQALQALAKRVAQQVIQTGKNKALEPMNPYERRIVHTTIQDIDGVISGSYGEGSGRRVIIAPEGGEIRLPKTDSRRGQRGGRKREKYPQKKGVAVSQNPGREPKKDGDIPLYGKIN